MLHRLFVFLLVCGSLLVPQAALAEAGTYRSPVLGYELSWDDSWTALYAGPGPISSWNDYLVLDDGIATLNLAWTFDYGDNASSCLEALIDMLVATDGVSDAYQLTDSSGADLAGHERGLSWIYAGFDLDDGSGPRSMGAVLLCQVFPDTGWGTLLVALYAPLEYLQAEYERVDQILASYRSGGSVSSTTNYGSVPSSSGTGRVSCDPGMVAQIQEDLASAREGGRMSSSASYAGLLANC